MFQQVILSLYRRFIHESSFYELVKKFDGVVYRSERGIRQLFADLIRWTSMMPCPPDVYRFKHKLMKSLPKEIRDELSRDGILVASSSVDQIMQRAIIVEKGMRAIRFYDQESKDSTATRRFKKIQGERHSTRPDVARERERARLQAAYDEKHYGRPSRSNNRPSTPRNQSERLKCFGCGSLEHFARNPKCPQYGKPPLYPRGEKLAKMNEDHGHRHTADEDVQHSESDWEKESDPTDADGFGNEEPGITEFEDDPCRLPRRL
ncbi:hypothetical protein BDZ89DRAFT_1067107 [Hymenopellis radicata]|nr:hypothetical protein BDZ89DRAFT_1067107 [Hymenopellis radicata]